jgi:hypothetical protein
MTRNQFENKLWIIDSDIQYWYSYVSQGLRNEIQGHSRKDQRTYQRKFCSMLSRSAKFKEQYPEYLI